MHWRTIHIQLIVFYKQTTAEFDELFTGLKINPPTIMYFAFTPTKKTKTRLQYNHPQYTLENDILVTPRPPPHITKTTKTALATTELLARSV